MPILTTPFSDGHRCDYRKNKEQLKEKTRGPVHKLKKVLNKEKKQGINKSQPKTSASVLTLRETKRIKRKMKDDVYSISNVVFTSARGNKGSKKPLPTCPKNKTEQQILIPQYKVLEKSYYDDPECEEVEADDNEQYQKMHRQYELAEACHRYLYNCQEVPDSFKGGLKIKLQLPKDSTELPLIIQ